MNEPRFLDGIKSTTEQFVEKVEGEAKEISRLENSMHKENKTNKYIPNIIFLGMYECFKKVEYVN